MKETLTSDRFPQFFAGLAALSLALVISSFIGAGAIQTIRSPNDTLTVTGSAKRPIRSDYIVWRASVSTQQATLPAGYRDIKRQTERVQRYLKDHQVPDTAVTLSSLETSPVPEVTSNGRETGRTLAYRLTQRFEVRSENVDRIAALSNESTELINEGIPFVSNPPEYLYTQLSKLRIEMVAEATKDARARAEAIATSAGNQIGTVRSAETGVFQITSRYSTDVSDSGIYDTSSLEKDITAVVSVKFSVK